MRQPCSAKLDLETRVWPGIVMLQEKCFLLRSSASNSSLQFDQCFNVMFRLDCCPWFQEIPEDNALCISEKIVHITLPLTAVT